MPDKWDIILWVGFLVVLLVGVFAIQYYFANEKDECMSNPLSYASKILSERHGSDFSGFGTFEPREGDVYMDSLWFNSSGIYVQTYTKPQK